MDRSRQAVGPGAFRKGVQTVSTDPTTTFPTKPVAAAWWGNDPTENSVLFFDRESLDDFVANCDPAKGETRVCFFDQASESRAVVSLEVV